MIVAYHVVLIEQVIQNHAAAQLVKFRKIDDHGLGALRAIPSGNFGRNWLAVGYDVVDQLAISVNLDGAQMIGQRVACSFARLGH